MTRSLISAHLEVTIGRELTVINLTERFTLAEKLVLQNSTMIVMVSSELMKRGRVWRRNSVPTLPDLVWLLLVILQVPIFLYLRSSLM
jgi:hypothetical protein